MLSYFRMPGFLLQRVNDKRKISKGIVKLNSQQSFRKEERQHEFTETTTLYCLLFICLVGNHLKFGDKPNELLYIFVVRSGWK